MNDTTEEQVWDNDKLPLKSNVDNDWEKIEKEVEDAGIEVSTPATETSEPPIVEDVSEQSETISVPVPSSEELNSTPYVLIFNKYPTKQHIIEVLRRARETFQQHRRHNCTVILEGFETDGRHLYTIPAVKKGYATLIENGLLGLLLEFNYIQTARESYLMCYSKMKLKGDKMRFTQVDNKHMQNIYKRSVQAYVSNVI